MNLSALGEGEGGTEFGKAEVGALTVYKNIYAAVSQAFN